MNKINVLNLYAGIGGNRKLWPNDKTKVTAVENNPEIAKIYQYLFPHDKVIVADAHQYLLDHYKEFDFIWSSPPCPSHSRARFWGWSDKKPVYPDMRLYQEIIFLRHHCKCKIFWAVENVIGYYNPLILPQKLGRHYIWSNFKIANKNFNCRDIRELSGTSKKDKLERNAVNSELGLHIFNMVFKEPQKTLL